MAVLGSCSLDYSSNTQSRYPVDLLMGQKRQELEPYSGFGRHVVCMLLVKGHSTRIYNRIFIVPTRQSRRHKAGWRDGWMNIVWTRGVCGVGPFNRLLPFRFSKSTGLVSIRIRRAVYADPEGVTAHVPQQERCSYK